MARILLLFAHPRFEKSRANRALLSGIGDLPGVTLHDLYEEYPDFNIDPEREKALLSAHDVIVWQYPVYMYGAPALLKQWIDLVLEYGWAHGKGGKEALKGKLAFSAMTAAGARESYGPEGFNGFTLREFLTPLTQTAKLCKMTWLPPFVLHGPHLLNKEELAEFARSYRLLLEKITEGNFNAAEVSGCEYLNDWLAGEAS